MMLPDLSNAIGISGDEGAVRKIVFDTIKDHVDSIRIDPMGSVVAVKKGTVEGAPRVMIAAHMDEIGFMVTGFDSNGLIRFTSVGGVDDRILPGLRVKVGKDHLPGAVIWTPIHLNREQKTVKMNTLRIDIGADKKEAASGKVSIGDRIAFDSTFTDIGETMMRGKAFDDRVGCSILIDVIQGGPYPVDVVAAFTVQEEVGLRGAQVAAQTVSPDVALILEGTTANDVPNPLDEADDAIDNNPTCRVGAGPAITVMDRSMITDPRMVAFLRETADANDIPYQLKTRLGGGTDGGQVHLAGPGRPTGVISMPCRYIHSPAALMSKEDYNNGVKLVQAALNALTADTFKRD